MLLIGSDWEGSNARSLFKAFKTIGCATKVLDTTRINRPKKLSIDRAINRLTGAPRDKLIRELHNDLIRAIDSFRPDIAFAFKAVAYDISPVFQFRDVVTVHYHPDDSANPYNRSAAYDLNEPKFDLHVTTKTFNVSELQRRGAHDVLYVPCAYDPDWHFRVPVQWHSRPYLAGFVGNRRKDRDQTLTDLSNQLGKQLVIAGEKWQRSKMLRLQSDVLPGAYGRDFSVLSSRIAANLVLLNHENRDLHTCRSYEVPATGSLFVGERTPEHEALILDGVEGLLFSERAELQDHLNFVSAKPDRAEAIALKGWERITKVADNTYEARANAIIQKLQ